MHLVLREKLLNISSDEIQQEHEEAAASVLIVFQLWFMGIPKVAQALKQDLIKKREARALVYHCQNLRKTRYSRHILFNLSKTETVKQIARTMLDNLKYKDILLLSLLAREFNSSNGIPSRELIRFVAKPFDRLERVISRLHNIQFARKNWSSFEEFQKSFKNVLAWIEFQTFKGEPVRFLHA